MEPKYSMLAPYAETISWYVWGVLVTFPTAIMIVGIVWDRCTCALCGNVHLPRSLVKIANPYYHLQKTYYKRFCNHCLLPKILSDEVDINEGRTKSLFAYPYKHEQVSAFGGRASGV